MGVTQAGDPPSRREIEKAVAFFIPYGDSFPPLDGYGYLFEEGRHVTIFHLDGSFRCHE
jgi:hypothetical protein